MCLQTVNSNLEIQFQTTVRHTSKDIRTRSWLFGYEALGSDGLWSGCRPGEMHKISHGECRLRREILLQQCPGKLQYFKRQWEDYLTKEPENGPKGKRKAKDMMS